MYELSCKFDPERLPAALIDRYRTADGPALKVAVWLLCGNRCDQRLMERELAMPENAVSRSIGFWLKAGLLVERGEDAPQKEQLPELGQHRARIGIAKVSELALRDPGVASLLQESQQLFGRLLSQDETGRILALYEYDELPIDVILMAADYSKKRAKRGLMGYIERVAREWKEAGVCTGEQAERHLALLEKREKREAEVAEILELDSPLTYRDRKFIEVWFEEYGYTRAFVEEAYIHTGKSSVAYNNAVIKSWYQKGYKTVKDTRAEPSNAPAPVRKKRPGGDSLLRLASNKQAD